MPLHIKAAFELKTKVQKCDEFMSWKDFLALAEGQPPVKVFRFVPNRFSYLAHTGGTTGEPKGVMLTDEAMNGIADEYSTLFEHERQNRWLDTIVPFVVYGFLPNCHLPLSMGMEVFLMPKVEVQKIPDFILDNKINFMDTAPMYLEKLPSHKRFNNMDLSFIRCLGVGGDGFTEEFETSINEVLSRNNAANRLMSGYGLSETGSVSSWNYYGRFRNTVGIPLSRNMISVFNSDDHKEMKYGEIGEICINTPYLMLGYLNNPEATDEVVKVHADGKKWFHTGDLGYITEEGAVYITGRIKRIILTEKDGMVSKIFPDRVEKLLDSHKAVEVSCVVKQPGDSAEVRLTAHVVLKEQYRSDSRRIEQELRILCAAELPAYSLPDKYVFRDAMPLTAVGKIDFCALEALAEKENTQ